MRALHFLILSLSFIGGIAALVTFLVFLFSFTA